VAAIDGWLEGILQGPSACLEIVLLISFLMGLRHATDPDHLAALTTLIASERRLRRARKASLMGLLWGLGHGTTLVLSRAYRSCFWAATCRRSSDG
jgi:high-affinity nickel permease